MLIPKFLGYRIFVMHRASSDCIIQHIDIGIMNVLRPICCYAWLDLSWGARDFGNLPTVGMKFEKTEWVVMIQYVGCYVLTSKLAERLVLLFNLHCKFESAQLEILGSLNHIGFWIATCTFMKALQVNWKVKHIIDIFHIIHTNHAFISYWRWR